MFITISEFDHDMRRHFTLRNEVARNSFMDSDIVEPQAFNSSVHYFTSSLWLNTTHPREQQELMLPFLFFKLRYH